MNQFKTQLEEQFLEIVKQPNSTEQDTEKLAILSNYLIDLNKLDYQKIMWDEEKENQKQIELKKIEDRNKRFDDFMHMFNSAGGINAVVRSMSKYFDAKREQVEKEILKTEVEEGLSQDPINYTFDVFLKSLDDNQLLKIKEIDNKTHIYISEMLSSRDNTHKLADLFEAFSEYIHNTDKYYVMLKLYDVLDKEQQHIINYIIRNKK
jgi:hypothetical protein